MENENCIFFQASCLKEELASETSQGGICTARFLELCTFYNTLTPEYLADDLKKYVYASSGGRQTPHAEFYGRAEPQREIREMFRETTRVLIVGPKSSLTGVKTDVVNHIQQVSKRFPKAAVTVLFGNGRLNVNAPPNVRILAATKERIRYYYHRIFRCGENIAVFTSAHGRSGSQGQALCLVDSALHGVEDPSKCIPDNDFKDHFLAFRINGRNKTAFVFTDTCHAAGLPGVEDYSPFEQQVMRSRKLGKLTEDPRYTALVSRVLSKQEGETDDWEADFLRTPRGADSNRRRSELRGRVARAFITAAAQAKAAQAQAAAEEVAAKAAEAAAAQAAEAAAAQAAQAAAAQAAQAAAVQAAQAAAVQAAQAAAEAAAAAAAQAAADAAKIAAAHSLRSQPSLATQTGEMFMQIGRITRIFMLLQTLYKSLPLAWLHRKACVVLHALTIFCPNIMKMDMVVTCIQVVLGWSYLYLFSLTICGISSIFVLLVYLKDYTKRMFGCSLFVSVMCLLIQEMCNPLVGAETLTVTDRINFALVSFFSTVSCILALVWASRRDIKEWKQYGHSVPSIVHALRILMAYYHITGIDTMSHGIRLTNEKVILYTPFDANAECHINVTTGKLRLTNYHFAIFNDSSAAGCNYTMFKSTLRSWTDGNTEMVRAINLDGERLDLNDEVVAGYIQSMLDHAVPLNTSSWEYILSMKVVNYKRFTLKHNIDEIVSYGLFKNLEYAGERFDRTVELLQSVMSVFVS